MADFSAFRIQGVQGESTRGSILAKPQGIGGEAQRGALLGKPQGIGGESTSDGALLKIDGVRGESRVKGFEGWIPLVSLATAIRRPGSPEVARSILFSAHALSGAHSPRLQLAVARGDSWPGAQAVLVQGGRVLVTLRMTRLSIDAYRAGAVVAGSRVEEFSISCDSVSRTYAGG